MPRIDFSNVQDSTSYSPLPEGTYECRISDVKETTTQYGDDMWNLTLEVVSGDYEDRRIFDRMVFSDRAMKRVKLICSALGLDVSGSVDLTPDMLVDRGCSVSIVVEDYEAADGCPKQRNNVLFGGYDVIDSGRER